jgi:hypothetical protein
VTYKLKFNTRQIEFVVKVDNGVASIINGDAENIIRGEFLGLSRLPLFSTLVIIFVHFVAKHFRH